MIILPSAYLPPISYFAYLLSGEDVVIDRGEHYIKRSIRNRASIMTAQGAMRLTVPICSANTPRVKMGDVRVDNSRRWQHQHWIAIVSAYRSSAYFDHYSPYLEKVYSKEWDSLVELNEELLRTIVDLLRMGRRGVEVRVELNYSDCYYHATHQDVDLRAKGVVEQGFIPTPYTQVFSDRVEFVSNLSILDLLFCEGPRSIDLIKESSDLSL